jgi:hypothetical protein
MIEQMDSDESMNHLLERGGVRVDSARAASASSELLDWANARADKRRRVARISIAGVVAGGMLLAGGAVAATVAGNARQVPTGTFESHWIYETSTGQVCDLWMQVEPDLQYATTGAEIAQAELDTTFARTYLADLDISLVDFRDGYSNLDPTPAPNQTQEYYEAAGIMYAISEKVGHLTRTGEPLMISISSRPICDPDQRIER